jgi:heptosyltransferase I
VKRILIVRMSALGDIVHALPVLAALREARPDVEVDWLADRKYAGILEYVAGISRRILGRPGLSKAVAQMRARQYDAAIDLQGLIKSAAMARLSGAERVIGFERAALREPAAGWFYNETAPVAPNRHIIDKNRAVLPLLGVSVPEQITFPFVVPPSAVADVIARDVASRGLEGFALINPGAAWPNKRWAADRFGAIATRIRDEHHLACHVLWGGGEAPLADAVVAASGGAAVRAPETSLGDLLALAARASLMVSGDTGPLHLAAAMQTPIVGLYGPTWPERNGPWAPADVVVSRVATCECHHKRECRRVSRVDASSAVTVMCINEISIDEVAAAVARRLAATETRRS